MALLGHPAIQVLQSSDEDKSARQVGGHFRISVTCAAVSGAGPNV